MSKSIAGSPQKAESSNPKPSSQTRLGHMLITGASSGLGAAMARHFSGLGCAHQRPT